MGTASAPWPCRLSDAGDLFDPREREEAFVRIFNLIKNYWHAIYLQCHQNPASPAPDPAADPGRDRGGDRPESRVPRNVFGGLPAAFAGNGAAAVVATLTKLTGPHGAQAAGAVVQALFDGASGHDRLGAAMTAARRRLVDDGLLVGLLLVSHGEIDLPLAH